MNNDKLRLSEQPVIFTEKKLDDREWDNNSGLMFTIVWFVTFLLSYLFFANFYFV
jgi:hypothetical protein